MLFLALVVFPYLDAVRTLATNAAVTLHATAVVAAQQQEAPQPRALEGPCAALSSRTGEPSKKRIRRYESKIQKTRDHRVSRFFVHRSDLFQKLLYIGECRANGDVVLWHAADLQEVVCFWERRLLGNLLVEIVDVGLL